MDSSTYRHLLGQFKNSCSIPHHNFPSHNLLSQDWLLAASKDTDEHNSKNDFLKSFPCYQPFPYVVQQSGALYSGSGTTDQARELVKKKLSWEKKLKSFRVTNIDQAVSSLGSLKKDENLKPSKNLREYIKHFHDDPEPAFSGKYNWLYTGGCLSYDACVVSSVDFILNKPALYLLKVDESLNEIQNKTFINLKTQSSIYQTTCKCYKDNLVVCARQKDKISLFASDICLFSPEKLWRKKLAKPKFFTCIDLKPNLEEVVTTSSDFDLNVFCIKTREKNFGYSGCRLAQNSMRDAWSQVGFGFFGLYWAFRTGFVIFDVRESCCKAEPDYTPSSATSTCEEICSFIESPTDPNYIYLGTTHNILQVDLRQKKSVQRWSHLMKNPLQFMTISKGEDGSEVLVLQSQCVDEVCGIVNERRGDGGEFLSASLPCLLKSVRDSFNLAQLHGSCLSPSVSKRVDFCVTGLTCSKTSEDDFTILISNSGGDIFASKVTKKPRESEDVEETLRMMRTFDYERPVGKSFPNHLNLIDMSHVVKYFQNSETETRKRKKRESCWKYDEMYSPESLMYCKDVLARKILKVWGHPDEEPGLEESTISVDDKVLEWMNKW